MNDLDTNDVLYWLLADDSSLSSSSTTSTTTTTSSSSISSCCDIGNGDDIEIKSRMSGHTTELISDEKRGWQFNDTMVLINSVEAHYDELSHPTKRKNVWKNVCNDLVGQNIEVTPLTCSKKWQNLVRSYKVCKNIKNKSGRGPVRFQFFDTLDNLLGSKNVGVHNIPTTSKVQNDVNIPATVDIGANKETEESSENQVTKRKCSFRKEFLMKKEQWKKRRQEINAEKLNLMKIKLDIEERKVKALEALVQLRNTE